MARAKGATSSLITVRKTSDRGVEDSEKITLLTSFGVDMPGDNTEVETFDGIEIVPKIGKITVDFDFLAAQSKAGERPQWKRIRDWKLARESIDLHEVDLESVTEEGKYDIDMYEGYLGDFNVEKAPGNDGQEVSTTLDVRGIVYEGNERLSEDLLKEIDQKIGQYVSINKEEEID